MTIADSVYEDLYHDLDDLSPTHEPEWRILDSDGSVLAFCGQKYRDRLLASGYEELVDGRLAPQSLVRASRNARIVNMVDDIDDPDFWESLKSDARF